MAYLVRGNLPKDDNDNLNDQVQFRCIAKPDGLAYFRAMPHLLIFLAMLFLGLLVSCVI